MSLLNILRPASPPPPSPPAAPSFTDDYLTLGRALAEQRAMVRAIRSDVEAARAARASALSWGPRYALERQVADLEARQAAGEADLDALQRRQRDLNEAVAARTTALAAEVRTVADALVAKLAPLVAHEVTTLLAIRERAQTEFATLGAPGGGPVTHTTFVPLGLQPDAFAHFVDTMRRDGFLSPSVAS